MTTNDSNYKEPIVHDGMVFHYVGSDLIDADEPDLKHVWEHSANGMVYKILFFNYKDHPFVSPYYLACISRGSDPACRMPEPAGTELVTYELPAVRKSRDAAVMLHYAAKCHAHLRHALKLS